MAPLPAAFISGAACFAARNAPSRFTLTQARQSASATSSINAVGPAMPALAQSTSTCPISAQIAATAASSVASASRRCQVSGHAPKAAASTSVTQT